MKLIKVECISDGLAIIKAIGVGTLCVCTSKTFSGSYVLEDRTG